MASSHDRSLHGHHINYASQDTHLIGTFIASSFDGADTAGATTSGGRFIDTTLPDNSSQ